MHEVSERTGRGVGWGAGAGASSGWTSLGVEDTHIYQGVQLASKCRACPTCSMELLTSLLPGGAPRKRNRSNPPGPLVRH